jgi:hypothetical protein
MWTVTWCLEMNLGKITGRTGITVRAGMLELLCGVGKFSKIWSACRQHEVQYTQWKMDGYTCNCMYSVTFASLCRSCAVKIHWQ